MESKSSFFIGYFDIEEWAKNIRVLEPVYASLHRVPGKTGEHGFRTDTFVIECSILSDGICHYCRINMASIQMMSGTPFDSNDAKNKIMAAEQAWEIISDWLSKRCTVKNAMVSMPDNITLVRGTAGFLAYTKEKGYYLKEDK